ncbi:MAG: rRNA maturation RNase YbeY [Phycisphaerales bacterium]|nr:rRNA maturation RNase YbeY [Phycisphaerales bacterium]
MKLSITATTGHQFIPFLRSNLLQALPWMNRTLQELSVALVGQARMNRLHAQFLGIDSPTDVLTFELDHDDKNRVILGEIVICVPYALTQAQRRAIAPRHELLLYAIHGVLHLTGLDDLTEDGYDTMHRKEDQILKRLGVGAVFTPGQSPRQPRRRRSGAGR